MDVLGALPPNLALAALFVFLAAIVRGFTGLGFALLAITSVSLLLPIRIVVPAMLLLEVLTGLHLFWSTRREVHWTSIRPLLAGVALGTPVGLYVLIKAPAALLSLALGVFTTVVGLLLLKGFALKRMPGTTGAFAAGAVAGATNGAFGIGGPPVFLLYLSAPAAHTVGRASMIACFLGMDLIYLPMLLATGLVTREAMLLALVMALPVALGIALGARLLKVASPAGYRRTVLWLVIALGIIATAKALAALGLA